MYKAEYRLTGIRCGLLAAVALLCNGCSAPTYPTANETLPSFYGGMISVGGRYEGGTASDTTVAPRVQESGADGGETTPSDAGVGDL